MAKKSELKNQKNLEEYLKNSNPYSVIVINLGDNSDISFNVKTLTEVDCNRLDYKIVALKIKKMVQKQNKTISDDSVKLLFDYCVGDLSKIKLEVEKDWFRQR